MAKGTIIAPAGSQTLFVQSTASNLFTESSLQLLNKLT
jgi:hypothetical protein